MCPAVHPLGLSLPTFNYPAANGSPKQVDNTFLWDYYYSKNTQQDANTDTYQTYYETSRHYEAYPLLATATPYIVGFPGKTYYEFDLSGEWEAENTATPAPAKLDKQTVSFVSETGISIGVSDDEVTGTDNDGYIFKPNYMSKKVEGYLMNSDGSSFVITPEGGAAPVPFRPYFISSPSSGAKKHTARAIFFQSRDTTATPGTIEPEEPMKEDVGEGTLLFRAGRRAITVESTLRHEADVRIVNMSGLVVANFTVQPGETVTTDLASNGVYVIIADGNKYQKIIAIK